MQIYFNFALAFASPIDVGNANIFRKQKEG